MVCSICKCDGHNKRTCPSTSVVPQARVSTWREIQAAVAAQDAARTSSVTSSTPQRRRKKPTPSEIKIQEILFENCTEIPDGLYKQLMDALVIA